LDAAEIKKRIELLDGFRSDILRRFNGIPNERASELNKRWINMHLLAVKNAVREAGAAQTFTLTPPPIVGGPILQNVDPFDNLFETFHGKSLLPTAADILDKAIGAYQYKLDEGAAKTMRTDIALKIKQLRRRIDDLKALDPERTAYNDPKVEVLQDSIIATIRDVFGADSPEYDDHQNHTIWHGPVIMGMPVQQAQQAFKKGIPRSIALLEGLVQRLEERAEIFGGDE